jgi:hypothetical protein
VKGGTRCRGGVQAVVVGEGVRAWVRCGGDGGGSAHMPLSGIGQSEREGERGEERAGDADAAEQNIN